MTVMAIRNNQKELGHWQAAYKFTYKQGSLRTPNVQLDSVLCEADLMQTCLDPGKSIAIRDFWPSKHQLENSYFTIIENRAFFGLGQCWSQDINFQLDNRNKFIEETVAMNLKGGMGGAGGGNYGNVVYIYEILKIRYFKKKCRMAATVGSQTYDVSLKGMGPSSCGLIPFSNQKPKHIFSSLNCSCEAVCPNI